MSAWCSILAAEQNRLGDDGGPDRIEPSFTDGGVVRRHTARRPLSCDECPIGRGIQPGEQYSVYVGLDDHHEFFCERHCESASAECRAAMPPPPPDKCTPPPPDMHFDDDHTPF